MPSSNMSNSGAYPVSGSASSKLKAPPRRKFGPCCRAFRRRKPLHMSSDLIQVLVAVEAGQDASWTEYKGRSQHEWQRFQSTEAFRSLPRDIDIIEINDGYAELITYADLSVPVVMSTTRNY